MNTKSQCVCEFIHLLNLHKTICGKYTLHWVGYRKIRANEKTILSNRNRCENGPFTVELRVLSKKLQEKETRKTK